MALLTLRPTIKIEVIHIKNGQIKKNENNNNSNKIHKVIKNRISRRTEIKGIKLNI